MEKVNLARRRFITGSLGTVGGSALAIFLSSGPLAKAVQADHDTLTDIEILNYALTLEHLEYAFYRDGLQLFSNGDFMSSKALRGFGNRIRSNVSGSLKRIRDHELEHVETLTAVVSSLGGTPVEELCYDFGYSDVDGFLAVAQALENTGVMAYDGIICYLDNVELCTAGATVATVEARHAAYLNLLNGDSPFPDAFDTPKTPAQIFPIAGSFIVAC